MNYFHIELHWGNIEKKIIFCKNDQDFMFPLKHCPSTSTIIDCGNALCWALCEDRVEYLFKVKYFFFCFLFFNLFHTQLSI